MLGAMSDHHDQLDPAETLMREVGAQLRQVRLDRGEALDDVGQQLRIKSTYLLGIEQGDLSAMPGRTYALGFLRSYADYLGFDGDDLITQIKSSVANLTDRTRLRMRTPLPESRLPKTPILALSLAAVAGIYAGWSYVNHGSQLVIETVAEVPASLRDLAAGALREPDHGIATPAADASRAMPGRAPAPGGPIAEQDRSALARTVPPPAAGSSSGLSLPSSEPSAPAPPAEEVAGPDRRAAAPTTAPLPPYPAAPWAAAPVTSRATAPASGSPPDALPVPAITPDAGPERSTGVAQAYAMARPPARPDAPVSPSDRLLRELPTGPGAAPGEAPPPEFGPWPEAEPPAAAATDVGAGAQQLAALPFDPSTIGPVGQIHEPENTEARVVLRALESSWIQISSPGGDYLRARTLAPNDLFLVPNRPDLALWTGNAGGLEVIVDGSVLAPLGDSGTVVRDVTLDPSSLYVRFGQPIIR